MAKYIHTQGVASSTWTINHNLGSKPVFDVLVNDDGDLVKIFPEYVEYVDDNQAILTFSTVRSGSVICMTSYSETVN